MFDYATNETLMQVSIYKISYCSADAAHGNVFAFVGSDDITSAKVDEQLICYVFLCQKRKVAQNLTLTVARSFEQAYQIWRDATERKQFQLERQRYHHNVENESHRVTDEESTSSARRSANDIRNLLIDFSSEITAEICSKDHRDLLQNTWVSFEDGKAEHCSINSNKLHDNSLWDNNKLINCA